MHIYTCHICINIKLDNTDNECVLFWTWYEDLSIPYTVTVHSLTNTDRVDREEEQVWMYLWSFHPGILSPHWNPKYEIVQEHTLYLCDLWFVESLQNNSTENRVSKVTEWHYSLSVCCIKITNQISENFLLCFITASFILNISSLNMSISDTISQIMVKHTLSSLV